MSDGSPLRRPGAALVVALVVGGLYVYPPAGLSHLDLRIYDLLLRQTHRTQTSERLVVVDVDERSLSELGRWPWPRTRLAQLLDAIRAHRPSSVAVEMMFPEPDEPARDRALADALRAGPFVIGYAFTFPGDPAGRSGCALRPMAVVVQQESGNTVEAGGLFRASGAICSGDAIALAAPTAGFLNASPDLDGVFRRVPQLITYDDRVYPSLALAAFLQARGTLPTILRMAGDTPRSLQIGDRTIPVDVRGNLLVHFRGGGQQFAHHSAADVLAERLAPGTLEGRIVFVGATALGIQKAVATPLDPVLPGVEIHATVVDNLLRGDFLRRPPWAAGLELSIVFGLAVGTAWMLGRLGSIGGPLAVAASGVGLWVAVAAAIRLSGVVISPLFPSLALVATFALVTVLNLAGEHRRAEYGVRRLVAVGTVMFDALTSLAQIRREKQRLDEALGESEARYRDLFEHAPVGLYQSAADGRLHDANPTLVRILGYPDRDTLIGTCLEDLEADRLANARRPDAMADPPRAPERRWRRHDGKAMWVKTTDRVIRDVNGEVRGYAGAVEDISGQKQAEEIRERLEAQLRQAQKMEALGRLAGGVAHDFNNVLTVIQGRGEILLDSLGATHPLRQEAEMIAKAADRAAALTHQLLAFSRKQVLTPRLLNLNHELPDAHRLLRPLLREDITIEFVRDPDLWMIRADQGQLHQIVMNLAVNARDAMPGGGRLVFAATNVEVGATLGERHRGIPAGRYVSLSVRDTGVGMDAETMANCFEPFFTTKDSGEGTGLGLATVYGIVKQHEGHIRVESAPGAGTTFTVYFPRVDRPAGAERGPERAKAGAHGHERILLVEDEGTVRSVTRDLLERAGFTVLDARDGAEALHLVDVAGVDIDLLLTDVVMPGLNGPDLARRLRARRPSMRILYMSGYANDAILDQGDGSVAFLDKPFTPESLVRTVRAVLDEGRLPEGAP